jgi:hypothetical protein
MCEEMFAGCFCGVSSLIVHYLCDIVSVIKAERGFKLTFQGFQDFKILNGFLFGFLCEPHLGRCYVLCSISVFSIFYLLYLRA